MKKLTKNKMKYVLERIAKESNTTVENVRNEIAFAMAVGMSNKDPNVKKKWEEVPHDGELPTPEEFILHMANQV